MKLILKFCNGGKSNLFTEKKGILSQVYSVQVKDSTITIALMQISFCHSAFAYFYTKTCGIAPICMYLIT